MVESHGPIEREKKQRLIDEGRRAQLKIITNISDNKASTMVAKQ